MGFFADYEEEKKKRKIDGSKTSTAQSFFQDELPKKAGEVAKDAVNFVGGTAQRAANTGAQGLDAIFALANVVAGDKDKAGKWIDRAKQLSDAKAIDGGSASFMGDEVFNPDKANSIGDAANNALKFGASFTKAGTDVGAFVQPELKIASLPKAMAAEAGVNAVTGAASDAAGQFTENGNVNLADAAQSGIQNGILAAGLRGVLNRGAKADQTAAKEEMANGSKAAQQATDQTGKPVTQSQVINSSEPTVKPEPTPGGTPMAMSDLSASAERPVGQSPADFLRLQNPVEPAQDIPPPNTTMAAEVTPGKDVEVQMPSETPNASNTPTGIVAKPAKIEDTAPQRTSALAEPDWKPADMKELDSNIEPFVNRSLESTTQKVDKSTDRYLADFISKSTKDLGTAGAETSKAMVKGAKIKTDIVNSLRPTMNEITKDVKSIAGKTSTAQDSLMTKMADALENRADAESKLSPEEFKLYKKMEKVYDYIKEERISRGLSVLDDYSPHQTIRDLSEPPEYLSQSLTKKVNTADSRYSKERLNDDVENKKTITVKDFYNYVNSQATEFGYKEANDVFQKGIKDIPESTLAHPNFDRGVKALSEAYEKAVNPKGKGVLDRAVQSVRGTVYKNVLWNNPKNTAFSVVQSILARGDVTPEAKTLVKSIDKNLDAEIMQEKWFGDATISADMAGESRMSKLGEAAQKFDINRKGEERAVKQPFRLGFAQGISETEAYKKAIKSGMSKTDAMKEAIKDPAARQYAIDSGNVVVNNTSFGANTTARPEFLRDASAVKSALTMFLRFPLGMTNLVKSTLDPKEARALDVLMKGDPRATPVAEMRQKYQQVLRGLNDVQKASKEGKFKEVPAENIKQNIENMKENIKTLDKTIESLSSIRGAKRVKALAAMWGATAAIQLGWTALTDPKNANPVEAVAASDPTIASKVNPANPYSIERGGITTPLLPGTKYGINPNGVANLIPGVGAVNRITDYATGNSLVDWLRGKTQ